MIGPELPEERIELSVVIPVYRSADTLPLLVDRLTPVLKALDLNYEIIFVEDAGGDASWEVLRELQDRYSRNITLIQLMKNCGQHNALMCGFRHSRGAFVLTMDDDLQHPPEEIPKLLEAIQHADFDVVYGVYSSKRHAFGRNMGSNVVNVFFRLVFRLPATVTAFRVLRRSLVDAILSYDLNFTYVDGLLAWNTRRFGQVTVEHHAREIGHSGYSLGKLLTLALNLFTNFSLLPLQMASGIGLGAALAGLAAGCYYLLQWLLGNVVVAGYASVIVAVLILGGLQLLALGVIGEYIGRLHLNVNRKPQYTIRKILIRGGSCHGTARSTEWTSKEGTISELRSESAPER